MDRGRRVALALLGLLLVPPPAAVAEGVPGAIGHGFAGRVAWGGPAHAAGHVALAGDWTLHWTAPAADGGGEAPRLRLEGALVSLVYEKRTSVSGGAPPLASVAVPDAVRDFQVEIGRVPGSPAEVAVGGLVGGPAVDVAASEPWVFHRAAAPFAAADAGFGPLAGAEREPGAPRPMAVIDGVGVVLTSDTVRWSFLYGFDVTIRHAGGTTVLRTGRWTEPVPPGPRGPLSVTHEAALLLRPQGAFLDVATGPGSARVAVAALDLDGSVDFGGLRGHAWRDGEPVVYDGSPARLEGRLRFVPAAAVDDASERRDGAFDVSGRVVARSLASGVGAAAPSTRPWVAAGAAGVAGLAVAAWLSGALFTRLRRDRLLDHAERQRLCDALRHQPGRSVTELAALGPTTADNVRYHLRVLARGGHVRRFKLRGHWRFALADADVGAVEARLFLETDPAVRALLGRVGGFGCAAGDAVRQLQRDAGLSRFGAWKAVRRAVARRLVVAEGRGRTQVLRPAAGA